MKKILFTGFEPFGGEKINPSWEAVRRLPDVIGGAQIVKEQVCVEYARSAETIRALIAEHKPDAAVCCGQAGGRRAVTPEVCAINRDHAEAPDNAGETRRYAEIIPGGPNAYFTALPVEKLVDAVKAAGIACAPSFSAGTYVCNHVYYTLLSVMPQGLFVHVPFIPEQAEDRNAPSMELADMTNALAIIAGAIAENIQAAD